MRRIKATLRQPGDNLGYVKAAVHAYIYMLARSKDDISSYSPSFFAREVVSGPDAVVSCKGVPRALEVLSMHQLDCFLKRTYHSCINHTSFECSIQISIQQHLHGLVVCIFY